MVVKNESGAFMDVFEYSYDYLNRRIRKVDYLDFTDERYEYQIHRGDDAVAMITDADGLAGSGSAPALAAVNLYGAAVDEILAVDDGSGTNGAVQWSLSDHEASVRDILDDTGTLAEHRDYTAYGEMSRFNPDGTPDTTALDFVFAFTGREWDDDIHLANHRARWYDPHAARFINQDPSGFAGGDANLYRYAGNNPVIFVDPSGLCTQGYALGDAWISTSDLWAELNGGSASGGYTPSVANSTPVNLGFESPFTSLTSTTVDLFPADLDLAGADLSLVHNDWGPSGSHALLEPKPIYTPAYPLPDEYLNPRVVRTYYETSIWDDYDAVKEHVESTWFGWALTRLPGFQLGESVVRAALPRSEPTRVNVMSDGTKNYKVTKGPSTQALIDQDSLILPVLKLPRVTPAAPAKVAAPTTWVKAKVPAKFAPKPSSGLSHSAESGVQYFHPPTNVSPRAAEAAARRAYLKAKFAHPDNINGVVNTAVERNAAQNTRRLQQYVSQVAAEVDAAGEAAFSRRQLRAILNADNPEAALGRFRGWVIDKNVRPLVHSDPHLRHLTGRINLGPDFVDPNTGWWWDMTTPAQWSGKIQKYTPTYGPNGTLLRTQ